MKSKQDLVSQRYAQALIDLIFSNIISPSLPDHVASDLTLINATIKNSPELRLTISYPGFSLSQKKTLLQNIFMAQVQEITLSLLALLVTRRRLDLLPAIEHHYHLLLNEKRDMVTAQLVSAEPLSENSLADIRARLNEYLGKKLELDMSVDPDLIAGYVIRVKDQVIDGSLKGRLAGIEKVLLSV